MKLVAVSFHGNNFQNIFTVPVNPIWYPLVLVIFQCIQIIWDSMLKTFGPPGPDDNKYFSSITTKFGLFSPVPTLIINFPEESVA